MHVGHMASHMCGTWQAMCMTHGMPCVIMHGHVKTYKYEIGGAANAVRGTAASSVHGSSKEEEEEGRKGEEKGRKGKEKWRRREEKERRKEKKKGEEEKKKKEENEGGLRSEQNGLQEVGFLLLWLFYA